MNRRDLLKTGAAAGLAGAAGTVAPGCATTGVAHTAETAAALAPPVDMAQYVHRLDLAMDVIAHADFTADLFAASPHAAALDPSERERRDHMLRRSLRALTATGAFLDLDERDRAHPEIQQRMWTALADIDDAIEESGALLSGLDAAGRSDLQSKLRADRGVVARIADAIDAKAELAGISPKRRRLMHRMTGQVGWRLREQDPSLVIDEYVTALERGRRATASRSAQTAAGEAAGPSQPVAAPPPPPDGQQPAPTMVLPSTEISGGTQVPNEPLITPEQRQPRNNHARGLMTTGGILMGLGTIGGGLGGLAIAAGGGSGGWLVFGLVSITVGALGLIAGIILLIIGGVRASRASEPVQQT